MYTPRRGRAIRAARGVPPDLGTGANGRCQPARGEPLAIASHLGGNVHGDGDHQPADTGRSPKHGGTPCRDGCGSRFWRVGSGSDRRKITSGAIVPDLFRCCQEANGFPRGGQKFRPSWSRTWGLQRRVRRSLRVVSSAPLGESHFRAVPRRNRIPLRPAVVSHPGRANFVS